MDGGIDGFCGDADGRMPRDRACRPAAMPEGTGAGDIREPAARAGRRGEEALRFVYGLCVEHSLGELEQRAEKLRSGEEAVHGEWTGGLLAASLGTLELAIESYGDELFAGPRREWERRQVEMLGTNYSLDFLLDEQAREFSPYRKEFLAAAIAGYDDAEFRRVREERGYVYG